MNEERKKFEEELTHLVNVNCEEIKSMGVVAGENSKKLPSISEYKAYNVQYDIDERFIIRDFNNIILAKNLTEATLKAESLITQGIVRANSILKVEEKYDRVYL